MNKLNRGRLLLSTCLTGIALASASGAQAQDKDPTWQPRAEVDARAADGSSQVSFELFAPLAQNDSSLMFVTGRIGTDDRYDRNGSVTIGGRGKIGEDVAIGVNAGVDFYKSDISKRDIATASFGVEGFTSVFDLHLNYRLPVTNRSTIGYVDPNASPVGVLSVENNRLIERKSGWRLEDVPLGGANAEVGATAPLGKKLSVRASAAGFDYRDDAASKAYRGVRGGLELGVEDPLGTGGRFSLGAELQNDNRWGTQARGTVRLSIPLGRGSRDRSAGNSGLDRQMGDRLRRDYVSPSGTRYTDLTSTSFAVDARTGVAFGGVYFTSGSGVAGAAGSSTATTTLGDAVTRAGANGIVVALGNAGNIASSGVTLATNQYLVGGASSVDVKHSDGSISAYNFGGTNGTIVGNNAGGAAVTLGTGSVVRDVTVRGSGSGILANGVGGFALERVVIENTGGAGLTLTNTLGNVVIDGITIRNGAGAGLVVNAGSNVTVRNSTIGGGAGAIDINDAGGNLTTSLSNLTLSATGGTVLDIDGSGAGTVTVAGLSGINIAGGNGETGGFAARYVTFDSSTAAGVQSVNAGTMQVGTAAARVNGAGVSLTEVDGALTFGTLNVFNNGGTGLTVNNTKTGTFTLTNTTGTVNTTAGTALNLDPLLIDLNFTAVSSTGATGAGIVLSNVQGAGTGGNALNIGTLTVTNSGQQGLYITGGSTGLVTIGGGTITNAGGASVQVGQSGVAGSGGTIGLNFGATITDSGAGPLVSLFNIGGAIRFTGAISGAGPITLNGTLAGSSVTFNGATTITGSASPAISLNNLAGTTTFSGLVTIANPTGTGIVIGSVPGGVTFGDVDITGLGAATGVNLTGTSGNVTFSTLDITGTGAAGSTGIDLTNAANAGAITITNPSVIQGVDNGVNLTNAHITGSFRYGDANAANGLQSRITANTVIVVAGMNATQGTYNFADVVLDGGTNNITGGSFTAYYVLAGANGTGTSADPGSIAGAAASGAQYIVLLNNPTGGQDVIDTSTLAGGALSLTNNQTLVSFLNTDFFAVTGAVVPANLILTNLGPTGLVNTYAGSGAAILTSTTGAATVNLASGNRLDGLVVHNDGVGIGVVGSGASNVVIQNSTISGNGGAISLIDGGTAASATLTNLNLSASGGTVLGLDGTGAGTLNVSGTGINVAATGSAQAVSINDTTVGTLDIGTVTTGNNAGGLAAVQLIQVAGGTLNIGSVTVGGTSTGAGLGIAGSSATVNVGAVSTNNTAGLGVVVSGNTGNVTLGAITATNSGSDAVRIIGNTGTTALGTITATNAVGAGLRISNNTGNINVAGASITGANNGIEVSNLSGNLTVAGATSIANSANTGIVFNGIGGNAIFGATTIANSAGIVLGSGSTGLIQFGDTDITGLGANRTGVDARASEGTVRFATLDITGTSATGTRGIDMTGAAYAGSFSVTDSSTITGVGVGVDLTNAHITGTFGYGDLSNTDADGAHSVINAVTPIAIGGFNTTTGLYNFADVALTGDTTALATNPVSLYFVEQGRTGTGTMTDPGSLAGALASSATVIVLLNNPTGGNDTLDVTALGTFTLDANQRLLGFLNGDTQNVGGGTPANMFLYGITPGIVTNPYAGSGAALLTNTGAGATVTLSNGSSIDGLRIGATGIGVSGIGVSNVSITNSIISGGTGALQLRDGGLAASATLTNLALSSTAGKVLELNVNGAGSLTLHGSGLSVTGTGTAGAMFVNGITLNGNLGFGAVSSQVSSGLSVELDYIGGSGTVSFGSIGIGGTTSGTGITLMNNSAAINLGNITIANTASSGLNIISNSGNVTVGTFSITNPGLSGIVINGLTGGFTATGSGTISNSFSTGISLGNIGGSVAFDGALTITNPGTAGIRLLGGTTGAINFADVDITGLTAGTTGLDARNASGVVTFSTLDITGASTTGTRGIDMTGATFAGNLLITGSSTITGVGTGVDLTNSAITGVFRFGDGSNTDANGAASTINATTPLLIAGLNAAQGTYDFADVNLVGDTSSLSTSATVYWVLAGATGTGTRSNPGSLAGAAASNADIIILVNNPAGGDDTIDVNGVGGTGGTFTLLTNQQLRGFLGGDTMSLPGGAPANVFLYNIAQGYVTNPFAGSGAPTLTSSVGGTDTVRVTGGNLIDGVRITSAGTGVYGTAAGNITISNSVISGADSAIELASGGGAASAALSNLGLTSTGASIPLALYVTGGGSMTVTQLSNITINQGSGSQGAYLVGATFDSDLATAGYQAVDASMVFGNSGARLSGNALNLTNALGALNFTALSIYNQGSPAIAASGTGLTLTSTGGTIDTLNGTNISLTGTQANLVLDNVVHAGTGGAIAATGITGIGAGGQALNVTNLQSTGGTNAILFTGINNGTVNFGAASSISGGSGAAISLESGTGTLNFNYDGSVTQANNAALLNVTNHNGTVTFGGSSNLDATNGTGLQFSNADGTYLFSGLTTLHGGNAGIGIGGGSSGNFTFGSGLSIAFPSGVAFSIANSTANVTAAGSISHSAAGGEAVSVVNHSGGTLDFSNASFLVSGGNGFVFDNADGTYSFNSATLTGGAGIAIANGSAGAFTFGTNTHVTDATSVAFGVTNSTAGVVYTGSISQSVGTALGVSTHSGGTLNFTGATFSVTGGNGLSFNDADGTYSFGDLALSGGARLALLGGSAGGFTFGNVDITGLAAGNTAVDLTGATGNVTFATLDIAAASATGTRGIDLTGSTTASNIIVSGSSTMTGLGVGVDLTNAAITGTFRYGDGSNSDANGAASTITATTPLVIAGLNGGVGTYNFADVNLNGDTTNLSVSAYFVLEGASGTGTRSDPGTLAGAEASGAAYIVLLNNPTGGNDTLDATAGAGGSLDLVGGQSLFSFRDTDSFTVGGGAPANVLLYNVQTGVISNPFAGSGAPTLTASGANATVTLGGGNTIDGVVITNSGTGAGILGNGAAAPIIIRNSTISGGAAGAIRIYDNTANVTLALSNLLLAANGGNILQLDGSGTGSLVVSQLSNLSVTHTTETGGFVFNDLTFDSDTVTAGLQALSAGNLTLGTTGSRISGTGLSLTNVTGTLNFGNLNIANNSGTGLIVANSKANNFVLGTTGGAIDTTNGTAINLDPLTIHMVLNSINATGGAYGVLLSQVEGDFTVTGAVNVSGASLAAISALNNNTQTDALDAHFQGAVTINNTTGTGVELSNNTGATFDFTGGLGITTTAASGFAAFGGGTISVTGAGNTINTGDGAALALSGMTVANAGVTFNNITAAPTGTAALSANAVTLNGALNIGGLTVTGGGTGASFSNLTGTGGVNLTGTIDLDTTGIGFDLAGTLGTINIANTAGSTLSVDGASTGIRFNGVTGGTVNVANGAGSASIGFAASSTAAAISFTGSSGVTLNYGGTITATAGSLLSSTNSSVLANLSGSITSFTSGTAFNFANAGGIYTISGAVSHTGGAGVVVDAASTGNVSFLNASKTFSTGTNTAISMAGSGTLSLLGGGLGITTTSGTGFSATGGTVVVLGSGNTIGTTTGQILSLSNTTVGGGGITFAGLTATGTVANNGILLSNLTGAAFNGGTVNIGGTSGAANDGIKVSTGTAAITFGATTIGTAGSNAIELLNSGSAVTFGTMNLAGANANTVEIAGSTGAVTLGTGTITATGAANYAVSVTGGTGDVTVGSTLGGTRAVFIDNHETGTVTFSGNMSSTVLGISVTNSNSGLVTFTGQSLALGGTGVLLAGNSGGTIDFNMAAGGNGLDISGTGTGFSAGSGGTVIVRGSGNSISSTGTSTALSLQNVTIGAGGFNFDSVSTTNSATGILLNGVSGNALNLGTVNLQGVTANGVQFLGILGSALTINDLDIGLNSNSATAFNLNGATINASILVGDFDVTNAGTAGTSIAVDLRGTTGGSTISLGNGTNAIATISNVGTGIYLNASTNALFTYGDGEAGTDVASTISALTAIDATNAPTLGSYDLRDVSFSGSPGAGFGVNHIYFVDADGATGGGNGSGSDGSNPMTLAAAAAVAGVQDIIILVNNGSAISTGGTTLTLANGVQVRGFGDGTGGGAGSGSAPVSLTITVPPTILLSGGTSINLADPTGLGAATLTANNGVSSVITLGATGNQVSGFILDGTTGVSRGISGAAGGSTNALLDQLTIRNFGNLGINFASATTSTIDHIAFSNNIADLSIVGGNANVVSNITSTGAMSTAMTFGSGVAGLTLTNVNITNTTGSGLSFFGTTGTVTATNVDLNTGTSGPALSVSGGTANYNFDATSSITEGNNAAALSVAGGHNGTFTYAGTINATNGTGLQFDNADGTYNFTGTTTLNGGDAGIDILNGSGGSFTFGTGTSITSPTGVAVNVANSTAGVTYSGSVTQANNSALLSVLNHSGGTITFQTGTLGATDGIGLRFDNADGTYNFTGTTTLNGGNAALSILNGSAGAFTFGTGASITSPSGVAVTVSGSTASLTYSGNITQANNVALLSVLNHSLGTITFQTGTLSATDGTGLQFDNADGTYNFNGTTTLNGGDAGVDIVNGSVGTFAFGTGASITNANPGNAFVLTDSNAGLTYSGSIDDSDGYAVRIDNHDAGTVTFQTGAITANGANALGISVTNSNGGTINFNGQTELTTGANNAITLSANAGGTIAFNAAGNGLDITTTSGTGMLVSGGGTINVLGANNSITTGSGTILDIANASVAATALNLNFASGSNTSGASGILVSRTAGTLTGTVNIAGGSITATDRGVDLDGDALDFTYGGTILANASLSRPVEVTGHTAGTVIFSGNITASNNSAGINVSNNTGGTIAFTGQSIQLDTNDNQAVTLANNTGATINFAPLAGGNGLDITTNNGLGFGASGGGTLNITGSGNSITTQTGGMVINLDSITAGASGITFSTLAKNSTNGGQAYRFNNLDGTFFTVTGGTSVNASGGGDTSLFIGGNSAAAFNFASYTSNNSSSNAISISGAGNGVVTFGSVSIDNANAGNGVTISGSDNTVNINGGSIQGISFGDAVSIVGGTGAINIAASITKTTTGNVVDISGHTVGAITLSGNISASGGFDNGILIGTTSGTVNFTGQSIGLSTGAFNGVTIAGIAGGIYNFAPAGGGNGLDITTTSGTGLSFTGGGTLSVTGSGNTVQTATGQILNLVNGSVGASGITFASLTGTGTIVGTAINISNLDGNSFSGGTVSIAGTSGATADGIFFGGGSTTNVSFGSTTITGTGDEGIEINGAGNGTFTASSVTINNTAGNGVEINGATNTVTLTAGAIGATNDPAGFGVYVLNGTGAVAIGASVTKTTVGNVVFVDNHETGTVNFSGNISATGGFNNGIVVQNVNSGTVQFGGTTTLSTGANTAVNLLNNTGGTISFPNGGLGITTTSGAGFTATGGGTVEVQGTDSTITSGAGTALNIANTTISSNGVNFRSISSNGAASGIILNNTGSAGGLRVVGTGSAGSGGTIQNSTGDGISLTSTENVRLAYMNVTNNLGDGIGGSNINGFVIDNLLISSNGSDNATDESGINITELTGGASGSSRPTGIFNSTIQNNNEFEVQITNSTGTLTNFQIVNSTFASNGNAVNGNATPAHGNLVNFLGTGTSSMGLTVTGSTFTGNWNPSSPPSVIVGSGLFVDSSGTAMTANVSSSNFYNLNNGINMSTGPGSTTLTYSIIGNTLTGSRSTAINDFHNGNAPFTRTVNGTIQNNVIGTNGVAMSGSQLGNGISIGNEGSVNANYLISGNTIQQVGVAGTSGSSAILVNVGLVGQATYGGTTNVTITNNTIRDILNSRGIVVNNNQNTGTLATIRLSMSGNQFLGTIAGQAGNGQYLRISDSGGGPFFVTQLAATASAIATELDDANGFNDTSKVSIGTGTFTYGAAAPTLPPAVVPLP